MELNSDTILSGAGGIAIGTGAGYVLKKTVSIILKLLMVLTAVFIGVLFYLQSIKVIEVNEQALNNLMNEGYNQYNQTIGMDFNPITHIATSLGLPMSSGLLAGLALGWSRG